jgi:glucose/arabinose dehydrogenase
MRLLAVAVTAALLLGACNRISHAFAAPDDSAWSKLPFQVSVVDRFAEPWAMAFLPDGRLLVTEKEGRLLLLRPGGYHLAVGGVPKVDYGGQGGFGDVALHPDFANNNLVYLSWAEAGSGGTHGAVVGRAKLVISPRMRTEGKEDVPESATLEGLQVIWRQDPKVIGQGHYSHRLAFSPDGYLFLTSGERQKGEPAQQFTGNLGKVIRLTDSGGIPPDNPWHDRGGIAAQFWTMGHRNLLGIAFDGRGQLWEAEMGPQGGDEINLIERGRNYGWPLVSNGDDYSGRPIPDHPTRPEFETPKVWWNPSISPSSLMIYSGSLFPKWQGNAFVGALSGEALIRLAIDGSEARKADQWDMGTRIRAVEQGPDGAIWLLEDDRDGSQGRLLKLTPR